MTGNASSGVNRRNASNGTVTPTTTPTTTSVGASAPSATRATPTAATSPAAAHLPMLRLRPDGTTVYSTPTSAAAKALTCADGIAQPPQLGPISTPNGRGRWTTDPITAVSNATTSSVAITNTMR